MIFVKYSNSKTYVEESMTIDNFLILLENYYKKIVNIHYAEIEGFKFNVDNLIKVLKF